MKQCITGITNCKGILQLLKPYVRSTGESGRIWKCLVSNHCSVWLSARLYPIPCVMSNYNYNLQRSHWEARVLHHETMAAFLSAWDIQNPILLHKHLIQYTITSSFISVIMECTATSHGASLRTQDGIRSTTPSQTLLWNSLICSGEEVMMTGSFILYTHTDHV